MKVRELLSEMVEPRGYKHWDSSHLKATQADYLKKDYELSYKEILEFVRSAKNSRVRQDFFREKKVSRYMQDFLNYEAADNRTRNQKTWDKILKGR